MSNLIYLTDAIGRRLETPKAADPRNGALALGVAFASVFALFALTVWTLNHNLTMQAKRAEVRNEISAGIVQRLDAEHLAQDAMETRARSLFVEASSGARKICMWSQGRARDYAGCLSVERELDARGL